jgi:hypothetical protein
MLIVDEIHNSGPPSTPRPAAPPDGGGDAPTEVDDVIRPGDGHVNGIESLCVGESQ